MSHFTGRHAWFRERAELTGETESRERQLYDAMKRDSDDEQAKRQYEELLARACPDALELELLRRQRELACEFRNGSRFDQLVEEFVAFRSEHRSFFLDSRGFIDPMFRRFKLWLVDCASQRHFALSQAIKLKLDKEVDFAHLPFELSHGDVGRMRDRREGIIDFVRRYRGPAGNEPKLDRNEFDLLIAPTWTEP
ncbi:MAG: hypothetical protein AAFN77_11980 [Planctomycetota bacterium]